MAIIYLGDANFNFTPPSGFSANSWSAAGTQEMEEHPSNTNTDFTKNQDGEYELDNDDDVYRGAAVTTNTVTL